MKYSLPSLLLGIALCSSAFADETAQERIEFEKGKSRAVVSGEVTGHNQVLYKLHAKEGQFLTVIMRPEVNGADFNIFIPDRGPGDEALFSSSAGGKRYLGQLYKTGNHTIQVFLNRAAAGRGDTLDYKMVVRVTDKQPTEKEAMEDEEVPSTAAVPQKVIDDCLAALRKQIPDRDMEVITATRGETSYIIDVKVDGVPKPWRCFHDGTSCTGTEYQGEG